MSKTIMVVDDSASIRNIITRNLQKESYNVILAEDGLDALNKFKAGEAIDLFLVDVNMPNMDGISFVKEIRSVDKKTPIIMVTTESQPHKQLEGQEAGANGWVVKPFEPNVLIRIVKKMLI